MMEKSTTKKVLGALGLSAFLLLMFVFIPFLLGLGRKGFDTQGTINQYTLYVGFGVALLVGLIILFMIEILIKEKDKKYGDGIGFANQGDSPSFKFFGRVSTFQLFLISMIIITILAFANYLTVQQSFFGLGTTPQQFTKVDSLVFRTFLVPAPENLGLAFIIGLYIVLLRYYARKKDMTPQNFWVFALIGTLLWSAIYGFTLHQLVYGGQETQLLNTVAIWTAGGLVTLLIGNFIIFFVLHTINNFFIDLKGFFPNEIMLVVFAVMFFALVGLYWYLYIRKSKSKFKSPI